MASPANQRQIANPVATSSLASPVRQVNEVSPLLEPLLAAKAGDL